MASAKKLQYHNVPFVIDGVSKIVKSVTKYTTCNDVITKLQKNGSPTAVFRVVNGEEKELPGKTKLLKVWRSHGSPRKAIFEVKASKGLKESRISLSLFGKRNSRASTESVSKDKLKQVTDLAFYVQYQKSKLQKMAACKGIQDQKGMHKMKSTSSMDSMDAFIAKADLQKMGQFLDFCSGVTASHLGETPKPRAEPQSARTRINKEVIKDSLKTMKLGLKRTLTFKSSIASKTTSTSTIESSDTGYHSQTSGTPSNSPAESTLIKHHVNTDTDLSNPPLHSTPITCRTGRGLKRKSIDDTLDVTLTNSKVAKFDEEEGKSQLLMRFMADATLSEEYRTETNATKPAWNRQNSMAKARHTRGPISFHTQKEKCHYYWNQTIGSESDSDSSCYEEDSYQSNPDLDEAFVEIASQDRTRGVEEISAAFHRTLRRESALTNLNKYDICAKPFDDTVDGELEDNGFSYSFNCTFPEFSQSQDYSVDYSCSDSDSDPSCSFEDAYSMGVKDNDFYSFMKSTSALRERSQFVGHACEEKHSEIGSDEGLGSMTNDSFSEDTCTESFF